MGSVELSSRELDEPSIHRLPLDVARRDEIIDCHRTALERDDDGYDDPATGLFVFTSAYLATRDCCDMGCRHCPYCE